MRAAFCQIRRGPIKAEITMCILGPFIRYVVNEKGDFPGFTLNTDTQIANRVCLILELRISLGFGAWFEGVKAVAVTMISSSTAPRSTSSCAIALRDGHKAAAIAPATGVSEIPA